MVLVVFQIIGNISKITICLRSVKRCSEALANMIFNGAITDAGSIDRIFRSILLLSKFFVSWGEPKTLEKILAFRKNIFSKGAGMELIERIKPTMYITKEIKQKGIKYLEGYFESPYGAVFPEMMPGNVRRATWCGFFPVETRNALVIHLAGTGDHSFLRRKLGFANSLLKMGISSILLENPFYGTRKPSNQFRSNLNNVSDLFVMGGALIAECNFLLNWAKESGYSPLGLSGVSMGGYMASLAYTNSSGPVSLVPCLSSSTAAPVFVKGALSHAVSWDFLDIELKNKSFRNAIKQIPDCEWIEKAYELNKCTKGISSHGVAKQFMYILMEEFTNIGMYPKPFDTSLVKNIIAEKDAYIVRSSEPTMQDIWPGSCVEILKGVGHVTAYLTNHAIFRRSIVEMLHRNDRIYHGFS